MSTPTDLPLVVWIAIITERSPALLINSSWERSRMTARSAAPTALSRISLQASALVSRRRPAGARMMLPPTLRSLQFIVPLRSSRTWRKLSTSPTFEFLTAGNAGDLGW
jgi:hypothetical protein